jgi:hypothetical protein
MAHAELLVLAMQIILDGVRQIPTLSHILNSMLGICVSYLPRSPDFNEDEASRCREAQKLCLLMAAWPNVWPAHRLVIGAAPMAENGCRLAAELTDGQNRQAQSRALKAL